MAVNSGMRPQGRDAGGVPLAASAYGYAGLIPFVACAVAAWFLGPPWNSYAFEFQIRYGATILSFLGAVHWGLALAGTGIGGDARAACTWSRLGWSVAPALVAWISLLMYPAVALTAQILAFAAVFFGDVRAVRAGLAPAWYPRLRRPLTAIVIVSLGAMLLRVIWRAPMP